MANTDNKTSINYTKNTDEGIEPTDVHLHKGQKCKSKAVAEGCENESTPWSDNCIKHSCNIVGCDQYVFTGMMGIPLCKEHYEMALDGVIDVG